MSHKFTLIENGRLLDPSTGLDASGPLFIKDNKIAPLPNKLPQATSLIDASGKVVCPGLLDIHVHLREPGNEAAETIHSGTLACAKGGFTSVVAMPNTTPPMDTVAALDYLNKRLQEEAIIEVLPSATISKNRSGLKLVDYAALKEHGAIAFSDDGRTPDKPALMRAAMREIEAIGGLLMDHAQDHNLELKGCMHAGTHSKDLKLTGIPTSAETNLVQRDIALAKETGCRVHIQHISSEKTLDLIREAKRSGIPVSAEVTPHHLFLSDENVTGRDTNFKMNPPLRSAKDRQALLQGVVDGEIAAFATDHAPHTAKEKSRPFEEAPCGIIGSETALGVTYTALVKTARISLLNWLKKWTTEPAKILGLTPPSLQLGTVADIAILDLEDTWEVSRDNFISKSSNSPFIGEKLSGRAVRTIKSGKTVWSLD